MLFFSLHVHGLFVQHRHLRERIQHGRLRARMPWCLNSGLIRGAEAAAVPQVSL